jgi:hypothetical protein
MPYYDQVDSESKKQWAEAHGGGPPSPVRFKHNVDGSRKFESATARRKRVNARRKEEAEKAQSAGVVGAGDGHQVVESHMKHLDKQFAKTAKKQQKKKTKKEDDGGDGISDSEEEPEESDTKASVYINWQLSNSSTQVKLICQWSDEDGLRVLKFYCNPDKWDYYRSNQKRSYQLVSGTYKKASILIIAVTIISRPMPLLRSNPFPQSKAISNDLMKSTVQFAIPE